MNEIREILFSEFYNYKKRRNDFYENVNIPMGNDYISWKKIEENIIEIINTLAFQIQTKNYEFSKLRINQRYYLRTGKKFYVSCVNDYLVEKLLQTHIQEVFEKKYSFLKDIVFSYSFGNNAGKLVQRIQKDLHNCESVLRMDIQKCMPSINKEKLKTLIYNEFNNDEFLFLLEKSLYRLDEFGEEIKGIPPGTPLSCFFMNFYLTQLDLLILKKIIPNTNIKYFRYGDDMFFVSSHLCILEKKIPFQLSELCKSIGLQLHNIGEKNCSKIYYYKKNKCFARFNNYTFNENIISLKQVVYERIRENILKIVINLSKLKNKTKFFNQLNQYILGTEDNNKYSLLSFLMYVNNMNQVISLEKYMRKIIRKKLNLYGKNDLNQLISFSSLCGKRRK